MRLGTDLTRVTVTCMNQLALISEALTLIVQQECDDATALAQSSALPIASSLEALTHFWRGNFTAAADAATRARALSNEDLTQVIALGVTGLAASGNLATDSQNSLVKAVGLLASPRSPTPEWDFARYLVAEAALACARLDLGTAISASGRQPHLGWSGHRIEPVMLGSAIRLAAFTGAVDAAEQLIPQLFVLVKGRPTEPFALAVASLVDGNANGDSTRAWVEDVALAATPRTDYIGRGMVLLAAFGSAAIGEVARAASLVLLAGGDAQLQCLTLIDRVLGLELLTAAAIADDDLGAAEAWAAAARPLAGHRITGPVVDRIDARIALMQGNAPTALLLATRSSAACVQDDRIIEAREADIILADAQVALHDVAQAARGLRNAVVDSDRHGHFAVRRAATRVLSPTGRRLPPPRGAGGSALSDREREVADLILAGMDNDQIAGQLFLSPHTVRVHVSRVLAAYGVATRIALLATTAQSAVPAPPARGLPYLSLRALTPRQLDVAHLVAQGSSNTQIGTELGISTKAVEKHVAEIFERWAVGSRFELAAHWWRQQQGPRSTTPLPQPD